PGVGPAGLAGHDDLGGRTEREVRGGEERGEAGWHTANDFSRGTQDFRSALLQRRVSRVPAQPEQVHRSNRVAGRKGAVVILFLPYDELLGVGRADEKAAFGVVPEVPDEGVGKRQRLPKQSRPERGLVEFEQAPREKSVVVDVCGNGGVA